MRALAMTMLIMLTILLSPLNAQEIDSALCSHKELGYVLAIQDEFDELLRHMQSLPTMDMLLEYSTALLDWRDSQAGIVLTCDDAFELGWMMSQMANDSASLAVMYLLQGFEGDLHYSSPLDASFSQKPILVAEIEAIRDVGTRVKEYSATDSRLPTCSRDDLEVTGLAVEGYNALLELAEGITSVEELSGYGETQIAWREATWSNMPPCEWARLYGLQMVRASEDLVVAIGLEQLGVSADENPYTVILAEDRQHLADQELALREQLERVREEHGVVWRQTVDLPACSDEIVQASLTLLDEYQMQGELPITSLDELLSFSREQMAWRAENLAGVPQCAESLEIQALLVQFNGDFVARAGLELAAVPVEDNPYLRLPGDQERVDALANSGGKTATDRSGARACTDAEKRGAINENTAEYTYMLNAIRTTSVLENFIAYLEDQIAWRETLWRELTPCAEVIEFGLLMQKIHSGYASFLALHYAGATPEQNPFYPQIQADRAALQALTLEMLQGAGTDEPVRDQAGGIPACGSKAMEGIFDVLLEYQSDLGSGALSTLDELLAYSAALMNWRESSLSQLPVCADTIKARMLLTQLTGDFVARSALNLAGVADAENPYLRLPSDRERLEAVGLSILDADRREPAADDGDLPACSRDQVDQLADIIGHYLDSLGEAKFPTPYNQIPAYNDAYLSWRAEGLSDIPPCAGALELGFVLNELSGDVATMLALYVAGADQDDIPQVYGAARAGEMLVELIDRLGI